ncbi:MAG: DAK2 domain-containing protein [Solirubrobacteraceae bacterium]
MPPPDLVRFRSAVEGALAQLEARRREVNDLNVFPVADGDTGDNMVLTLRAVLGELDRLAGDGERSADDIGRQEIVDSVARAALLGARGNSGVILSQLIRGAAEELASRRAELVDPVLIGAAMARGADRAYASVRDPAEGTILTVMREMAHRVVSELARMPEPRLPADALPQQQDAVIADVLERAIEAGKQSVLRGPDLLPVLREAGVVDAGGHAVTIMFAGIVAALRGAEPPRLEHHAPARVTHPQHRSSTYRYCTNFAVTGSELDSATWIPRLEAMGDSVLVVGDQRTLKVHVHTDDPEGAAELFADAGAVSHLDVADMREQERAREQRLGARNGAQLTCGALAVVSGAGMRSLFQGVGVHALDGGPALNPSTYDLLAGIHAVPAEQVVVLANSPNVVMAAERAAELSDKQVRVVDSTSQQAGLAAAVAFEPGRSARANAEALADALRHVRTGAVAPAARDDGGGRFRAGEAVGFVNDEVIAWGEPEPTLRKVLGSLGEGAELVTCIRGQGAPLGDERIPPLAPAGVEVECSDGGQPRYWWLISAE